MNGLIVIYTIVIALTGAFSILYAKYDALRIWYKSKDGDETPLNHTFRAYVRVGFCALVAILTFGINFESILIFLIGASNFYLIFDIWLNEERGKDWFYLGATSKIDKWVVSKFKGDVEKAGKAMFVSELFLLILWSYLYFSLL